MKKKYIYIISVVVIILLVIGYNLIQPKSGTMICTYNGTSDDMGINLSYEIEFKDKMVTNLKAQEIITLDDKKKLEEYKETLDMIYMNYDSLKHYDVEVLIKDKKLITNALINYKKLDKDEIIKIDPSNKDLYKGKKIPLRKLKNRYKNNGAKCKYV